MEKIINYTTITIPIMDLLGALVPEIQRNLDQARVDEIYSQAILFYNTHEKYLTPGKISIAVANNIKYIIDGQHRLRAYQRLAIDYPLRPLFVTIDQYTVGDMSDIEQLYKLVNTCIPNDITRLSIDEYKAIKELCNWMAATWPKNISKAKNPRVPNISLEAMGEVFIKNKTITRLCVTSGRGLIALVARLNDYYGQNTARFKDWGVEVRPGGLYLSSWRVFEWVERLGVDPTTIEHYSATRRVKITKKLRMAVWASPMATQPCYCCGHEITMLSFQCGHVIPLCNGGPTTCENLRPICEQCNKDMGTMNLLEYKKLND
jgi:hypothetical protein